MTRPKDLNSPSPWNVRIWDVANKEWLAQGNPDAMPYYGFDIRGGETTVFQGLDWIYKKYSYGGAFIWERSTGLRDKHGVEIYEGDLIDDGNHELLRIVWSSDDGGFIGEYVNTPDYYCDGLSQEAYYYEVVGDVHNGRYLMEEKENA